MQIRRPLCLVSLIFVLLLMSCIYSKGRPDEPLPEEGEQICLTGIVKNKEYRVMYGEKIPILYVSSVIDKSDRQVMCYMKGAETDETLPRMGETVKVSGKVSLFREASNPGEFDLKEYYQILNVSYKLSRTEILERSESGFPFKEKLFQIKCSCCEVLEKIYPEKEASILKAMLLGEKNGLEEETKELYQLSGLIHILAISGLHISLLGAAVSGTLKKGGVPVWLRAPAAVVIMWCYGVMTGMGVSTWRAVFMFSLHLAAELFGRTYDMLTALSLAAVFMLAEQPLLVWHSGFLLSFGAVLGIGLVLPWWKEVLGRMLGIGRMDGRSGEEIGKTAGRGGGKERSGRTGGKEGIRTEDRRGREEGTGISDRKSGRESIKNGGINRKNGLRDMPVLLTERLTGTVKQGICLGSAIGITTLPVLFYFYYRYPIYSLILNLYVIPLMGLVFAVGAGSMAVGFLLPEAGVLCGLPDRLILWLYEVSCRESLRLPGAVKIAGQPKVWQIVVYYGILFSLILRHTLTEERKALEAAAAGENRKVSQDCKKSVRQGTGIREVPAFLQWMTVLGILWLLLLRPFGGFAVSFLDVGQGDCIVMRGENGNCYMVDGGSTSKSQVGKYQILPFLESQGIGRLKAVFLTHPDEDHITGVMELMEQSDYGVRIDSLILPDTSSEMKQRELAELRKKAAEYKIPVYYIGRGEIIQDGRLKLTCLGPEKGIMTDEVNEISTVLYVEYGAFSMLLTGDVTGEPERELLPELEGRERLTVLKVAHHGSKYSTPREFLEMTDPVAAIISAGKDNRYGHPHEELTDRLKEQGCHIYQTVESGAVTVEVWGKEVLVKEFLK